MSVEDHFEFEPLVKPEIVKEESLIRLKSLEWNLSQLIRIVGGQSSSRLEEVPWNDRRLLEATLSST